MLNTLSTQTSLLNVTINSLTGTSLNIMEISALHAVIESMSAPTEGHW